MSTQAKSWIITFTWCARCKSVPDYIPRMKTSTASESRGTGLKTSQFTLVQASQYLGLQIGLSLKTDYCSVSVIPLCCDGNDTVCVAAVNVALAAYGKAEPNLKRDMMLSEALKHHCKGKQIMDFTAVFKQRERLLCGKIHQVKVQLRLKYLFQESSGQEGSIKKYYNNKHKQYKQAKTVPHSVRADDH